MKIKSRKAYNSKQLARHSQLFNHHHDDTQTNYFASLKGKDVISARVSDHHPVIHDGVLFWNIMMQGKKRTGVLGDSYNNGFGLIETDKIYRDRLIRVGAVIAEIVYRCPSIKAITLCEGPIKAEHSQLLVKTLRRFHWMQKFFKGTQKKAGFYQPNNPEAANWGLLMLADQKYTVENESNQIIENCSVSKKLANRLHIWQLSYGDKKKFLALGHFPFGGNESCTEQEKMTTDGKIYCDLITHLLNQYEQETFIFCADFNFNPHLISRWQDRENDKIAPHNSVLLLTEAHHNPAKTMSVTVDGILLSAKEKQKKFYFKEMGRFILSSGFYKNLSTLKEKMLPEAHRKEDLETTDDKIYGLIAYSS
jgi:hypothetical protein